MLDDHFDGEEAYFSDDLTSEQENLGSVLTVTFADGITRKYNVLPFVFLPCPISIDVDAIKHLFKERNAQLDGWIEDSDFRERLKQYGFLGSYTEERWDLYERTATYLLQYINAEIIQAPKCDRGTLTMEFSFEGEKFPIELNPLEQLPPVIRCLYDLCHLVSYLASDEAQHVVMIGRIYQKLLASKLL